MNEFDNALWQHKIGGLQIYKENVECGQEIINEFAKQSGPPILIAQAQQGKTGTAIYVIDQLVKHWESLNKDYQIIYLINVPDNEIRNQTSKRLGEAQLKNKVDIIHHKNLTDLGKYTYPVDYRCIIMDECHYALEHQKPLHNFFIKCGIKYGRPISEWENKNNYVLSISATPFVQILKSYMNEDCFTRITLPMSDKYYSVQHADGQCGNDSRFFASHSVIDKKHNTVTDFYKTCLENFKLRCKEYGNGFQVVRVIKPGPSIIQKYIETQQGIDIKIYSCHQNNLAELGETLSSPPKKYPTVIIISGALRAGKTLETTRFIRQWIDTPDSKNTDTTYQSIGRCLGYQEFDGHSKFDDQFPIYCNTNHIKSIIDFYNDNRCTPNGIHGKQAYERKKGKWNGVMSLEEIPIEHRNEFPSIARVSEHQAERMDLLKSIMDGAVRSGVTRTIFVDAPSPVYPDSWTIFKGMNEFNKYPYFWFQTIEEINYSCKDKINRNVQKPLLT